MSRPDGPMLVLGIGNVLLRDDGVGVQVVHALQDSWAAVTWCCRRTPRSSTVARSGVDLLPWLAEARAVVLVDAADDRSGRRARSR